MHGPDDVEKEFISQLSELFRKIGWMQIPWKWNILCLSYRFSYEKNFNH
jgi:hypothetical protein